MIRILSKAMTAAVFTLAAASTTLAQTTVPAPGASVIGPNTRVFGAG